MMEREIPRDLSDGDNTGKHAEYGLVHDTWPLKCAAAFLTGLINRQEDGGFELLTLRLDPGGDVLEAVIVYEPNKYIPPVKIGYRLELSRLRSLTQDPAAAGRIYLDDIATPFVLPEPPGSDKVTWIIRPPRH